MKKNYIKYISHNNNLIPLSWLITPNRNYFKNKATKGIDLNNLANNLTNTPLLSPKVKNIIKTYTILNMPLSGNLIKPCCDLLNVNNNFTNEPIYQIIKRVNKVKHSLNIFRI